MPNFGIILPTHYISKFISYLLPHFIFSCCERPTEVWQNDPKKKVCCEFPSKGGSNSTLLSFSGTVMAIIILFRCNNTYTALSLCALDSHLFQVRHILYRKPMAYVQTQALK